MTDYKLGKFLVQKDFQKTGNFQKTDKTENFFSENRKLPRPFQHSKNLTSKHFFIAIYNASKLLRKCQIDIRNILEVTTNWNAKNCSFLRKPELTLGRMTCGILSINHWIILLPWKFRYHLKCEFLAARLTQCSYNLQKIFPLY